MDKIERIIREAEKARERAYAPYSKFRVGAALLTQDGSIYTGCNVENASFGAACCAERVAVFKAISDGRRDFTAMAVVSDSQGFTFPCGICRQVMAEFKIPVIIVVDQNGRTAEYKLNDLLPHAFDKIE
ncbi:MAG: cytidine deaminase [Clostridiales bacterium]|jgi:cytidine deaminase|nr:cytidine deaminase [Clostridiales bacterium]